MPRTRAVRTGEAVRDYLATLLRREVSADHLQGYTYMLNTFLEAFGESTYMSHLNAVDIERFFYGGRLPSTGKEWRGLALKIKGMGRIAGTTWNRRMQLMDQFLRDMVLIGTCEPNLMVNVFKKRVADSNHIRLTPEEIVWLLDSPELPLRDVSMLATMADHGVRSAELRRLRIGDYNPDQGMYRLQLTKSRSRELQIVYEPVTPDERVRLHAWLAEYAAHFGLTLDKLLAEKDWQLHPRRRRTANQWDKAKGKLIGERILIYPQLPCRRPETVMQNGLRLLGYTEAEILGNGVHCMRRAAADAELEATGDIRAAQHLLRHASQKTTEKYVDKSREIMEKNKRLAAGGWRGSVRAGGAVASLEERRQRNA